MTAAKRCRWRGAEVLCATPGRSRAVVMGASAAAWSVKVVSTLTSHPERLRNFDLSWRSWERNGSQTTAASQIRESCWVTPGPLLVGNGDVLPDTTPKMTSAAKVGSGGAIPTNSTLVIPFSRADRRRKIPSSEIPSHCGRGHPLTPGNLQIAARESRWRCRQCGRERATAFRRRQKPAA